jgi:WD40 repeat protein
VTDPVSSTGGIVPHRSTDISAAREGLVSRGRELALKVLGPTIEDIRWSQSFFRSVRWAAVTADARFYTAAGDVDKDLVEGVVLWGQRSKGWIDTVPTEFTGGCGAISPDGTLLAIAAAWGEHEGMRIFRLATGEEVGYLALKHFDAAIALAFDPDGQRLGVGTLNGTVRVWDVRLREQVACIGPTMNRSESHVKRVLAVAMSGDSRRVLSGSRDATAAVWDVESGREVTRFDHDDHVKVVSFAGRDGLVITGSRSELRVWEAENGRSLYRFRTDDAIETLALSPDERWLLAGAAGVVTIWDFETGRMLGQISRDRSLADSCKLVRIGCLADYRAFAVFSNGRVCTFRIADRS